jgi:indolepyruvate ferredoxin oxidoreductase
MERQLIADYRARIEALLPTLNDGNLATAIAIASVPDMIRGFGPVKEQNLAKAQQREAELVAQFEGRGVGVAKAAE